MAVPATQLRRGMVIVFEGEPVRVVEFRHHTPGNLRAMVQAKLKSLKNGNSFDHRFRAADSIEPAYMETHELEYMYDAGGTYHFTNARPCQMTCAARLSRCMRLCACWAGKSLMCQALRPMT